MHLFLALYHLANLLYTGIFRHLSTKRTVPIVLDCPHCQQIRLAKLKEHLTYGQFYMQFVPEKRSLTCQTCRKTYNANSFHPDPTGIYQLKT